MALKRDILIEIGAKKLKRLYLYAREKVSKAKPKKRGNQKVFSQRAERLACRKLSCHSSLLCQSDILRCFVCHSSRVKTTICFYLRRAYCALQSIHIFLVQVPRNFASDEKELSRQLSRSDLELHSPLPTLLSRSSRLGDFGWLSFVCGALRAAIIPAFFSLCFRNNHFERDPGCPGDPRVDVNRKRVSKFLTRGELV